MKRCVIHALLIVVLLLPGTGCSAEPGHKDTKYTVDKKWLAGRQKKAVKRAQTARMKIGVSSSLIAGEGTLTRRDFDNMALAEGTFSAIIDSGAKVVRVGAVDDAWILNNGEEIERADGLVRKLQNKGLSLFLWDWQFSYVLNKNKVSWAEYKELHLKRIEFFIERYRPEYYSIVTEPMATAQYNVKEKVDLQHWFEHIQEMVDYFKVKYPKLKLAVLAAPGEEDAFLEGAVSIRGLDIVGIELYYPRHVNALEAYLKKNHPHKFGKEIWLLETWAGMPYPFTEVEDKEKEDIEWLKAMFEMAVENNFDGFMPWPWIYFVTYDRHYVTTKKYDYSRRTAVFNTYKGMAGASRR